MSRQSFAVALELHDDQQIATEAFDAKIMILTAQDARCQRVPLGEERQEGADGTNTPKNFLSGTRGAETNCSVQDIPVPTNLSYY